ncbi:MAG: UDP-glucose 4-epimerase GalE [Methanobacteriaceae archaeon]|jgi:UDP-glucose 4-epimerase|nr:UDP-glucose 4-epimerase GalE [Methanobacteriaceae archaeon]MDP2836381.1 UDP-glucose 4-epimerase GalE [Methanobacteriaceae archaeon]MDP3035380.1 UDP-glucose 4-epimerase GalE [Methanobacteriaceae archaeon]MDP3624738.1 UDP-glucose 4-epimerase GalE [Methanobacteriaceae archaeon]PKL66525.1 MAG: UDP-glucose 4-epimerase GalE [Methanobacteriales archaeon HGW-Methanobacteriales-1]
MILIVGGAGYIGSHVNKVLHENGEETLVLDNLSYGHEEFVKWGKFVKGDLSNTELLTNIFKKYTIDAVMHFAAFTYVGESVEDPQKYYVNNLKNTLNLLAVMKEFNVNKFIFSSTCAVYGEPQKLPLSEDHPLNPMSPYGNSKLMVEKILEDYSQAYDLSYVSLRYFNAAGADPSSEIGEWHNPETHLIPLILDAASERRESVSIYGTNYPTPDGTCIRDYIHVLDLAQAHYKALKYLNEKNKSQVFNLGNGNGFSVKEVIQTCQEVTGNRIKVIEDEPRPGDPPILVGSSKKAREVLGWNPQWTDLQDIISTAWNWYQKLYMNNDNL